MSFKLFTENISNEIYNEFNKLNINKDLLNEMFAHKSQAFSLLFSKGKANILTIQLLEKHDAKINDIYSMIHNYFHKYTLDYQIVKWLLSKTDSLDFFNKTSSDILFYSLCQNSTITPEILELAIGYIIDINYTKQIKKEYITYTPLDAIIMTQYYKLKLETKINCIKVMLKYGATIVLPLPNDIGEINYLFFRRGMDLTLFNNKYKIQLYRYKKIIYLFCIGIHNSYKLKIPIDIIKMIIKKIGV